MVVFSLCHGLPELCRVFEHADQDLQTVQIRVLRRDHLKNGLIKEQERATGRKHRLRRGNCTFVYYNNLWLAVHILQNGTKPVWDSHLLSFAFLLTHPVRQPTFLHLNKQHNLWWKYLRGKKTTHYYFLWSFALIVLPCVRVCVQPSQTKRGACCTPHWNESQWSLRKWKT